MQRLPMTTPIAQPAVAQLIDLLETIRPDWPRHQIDGAIAGAATRGVPWQHTHHELVRLAVQDQPLRAFTDAHRSGPARHDPEAAHRGAGEARKLLGLEGT